MSLRRALVLFAPCLLLAVLTASANAEEARKQLKAGIIGLDTSHVTAFTKALNNPNAEGELKYVKIVAAYPAGSPDVQASFSRVKGFTEAVQKMGVEIVDSIDELLPKVDVVFLESVDGRPHLEQVKPVLAAGKPVFIDKPIAASLADAVEIFRLAKEYDVPCFSSSSLRFSPDFQATKNDPAVGDVLGCVAWSPCSLEEHHPDLFWYGVHGVETLFTFMGPGLETVQRTHTDGADVVTGTWEGGRIGTFRGLRDGKAGYGALVFGSKKIAPAGNYGGYPPMLQEICKFFQTGQPPVSAEETIQIAAFMQAADESKRQGGKPINVKELIQQAKGK